MKIKLLDFTITADVSEAEEEKFKEYLKEKHEVSGGQLLDDIILLEYMLESIYSNKDGFVLSIYNVSTVKHKLPNSKIIYRIDFDIEKSEGINIESWRAEVKHD